MQQLSADIKLRIVVLSHRLRLQHSMHHICTNYDVVTSPEVFQVDVARIARYQLLKFRRREHLKPVEADDRFKTSDERR